jgi:hypothetical protein
MERAGGGETFTFRQGKSDISVTLSGRLRVSAAEGVRTAVLSGLGYAIASEWMFAPELASGAVRAVLTDWILPPLDFWALFPTGRMVTAKARAFANLSCQYQALLRTQGRLTALAGAHRKLADRERFSVVPVVASLRTDVRRSAGRSDVDPNEQHLGQASGQAYGR